MAISETKLLSQKDNSINKGFSTVSINSQQHRKASVIPNCALHIKTDFVLHINLMTFQRKPFSKTCQALFQ